MNLHEKIQSLKLAEHYFRINQYSYAKHILEKIIEIDPDNSKANELLSYIYENLGQLDISFDYLNIACSQKDCSVEALYYLGSMLLNRGFFNEASEKFKKSILKGGEFFEALHDLATAQAHTGDLTSALINYKKCLAIGNPSYELFFNIARIYDEKKLFEEAITYYDDALKLKPDYAEGWSNKGVALYELKCHDEAIFHYDKALSLRPDYAECWSNKGNTLNALKRFYEAIAHFDKALSLKPDYAEGWSNKGIALNALKRFDEAISHYDQALTLKPDYHEAWANKGQALQELKRYEEAIAHYDQALSLKDDIDWLYGALVHAKMNICSWLSVVDTCKSIVKKVLASERVVSPFALLALIDDASLHKKSAEIYVQDKYPFNPALGRILARTSSTKIRIGYFSADFKNHPVSSLTAEMFELHDKNKFEIIAFSLGPDDKGPMRLRLRQAFNQFIDVGNMSEIEVAKLSRELKIDIAVDLGGHTLDSPTAIFSYRAAPVQISYIGYLGTMGAPYIDYILADKTLIPDELQRFYSEKIAYLPSYQANDRKRITSDRIFTRQELGLPEKDFVFCCFNSNYKILPATFDSWARILKAVEGSVLFLYAENQWAETNLKKEAEARGINSAKIVFGKRISTEEYLARYRVCDLFLDTLPYNAGTTASDALWSGVPVLTLMGQSFASRMAASLLNAVGLPELVTCTQEEYEALAIELALNSKKLAGIKLKLAQNRLSAPLFDAPLFTKNLEAAYIQMHERYQNGLGPSHISIVSNANH